MWNFVESKVMQCMYVLFEYGFWSPSFCSCEKGALELQKKNPIIFIFIEDDVKIALQIRCIF